MKTKNLITTIAFAAILFMLPINAQPSFKPHLDGEIVRWSFVDERFCGSGTSLTTTDIVAYGDTVINGVKYRKLFMDFSCCGAFDDDNISWKNHVPLSDFESFFEWEHVFIRESEDFSRLYIYDSWWDIEFLISDMNLQVGETFQLRSWSFLNYVEAIVDSVYYKNDLKHIQWRFTDAHLSSYYHMQTFRFIESVGPDYWFTFPQGCNPPAGFNCFQNQTTFYKNERTMNHWNFAETPCGYYYFRTGVSSTSENKFHVFVQRDVVEVFFISDKNIDVSVYDVQGRLWHSERNFFGQRVLIPRKLFNKGVYVLNIFDRKTGQVYSTKIIL